MNLFTARQPEQQAQAALPRIDYIAYIPGEKLKYDLSYSDISAGAATFEIKPNLVPIGGSQHYHVSVTGKSYPFFDKIYKVRDYYESYINNETLFPSVFIRDVSEGKYKDKEYYIFNRVKNEIKANDKVFTVQDEMFDIVSAFYYLRCIDFSIKPAGYEIDVNSFFDEEILPMGVVFTGRKTIKTSLGKINCLVFKPKLIEGRVFQDQEDMTLYVSDDKNQIPIRIESKVYLGIVRADLIQYSGLKFPFSAKQKK